MKTIGDTSTGSIGPRKSDDRSSADSAALAQGREDADNRQLFEPGTKYSTQYRRAQVFECVYIVGLMLISLVVLSFAGLGVLDQQLAKLGIALPAIQAASRYEFIASGGLLGGTVYSAKWLYHAIAKGLWHQDRQPWRFMSPWIALGTTIGICALLDAGFFRGATGQMLTTSAAGFTGMGFLVGYLADSFLAKMKEVTRVIFGESESRPNRSSDDSQR